VRAAAALALVLLASGCGMRHLARTVGEGNAKVRASVGGPMFSNLGAAIPLPNVQVGGRYGLTDGFDLDADLSLHGDRDDFVVPRHAEMLRDAARTPPTVVFFEGADHSDIPLVDRAGYEAAIVDFVTP